MQSMTRPCALVLFGALFSASTAFAGPDWDLDLESDAGATPGTAQLITLSGSINRIIGMLTGAAGNTEGDYQDVYQIYISDPGSFMISLSGKDGGALNFDACLWLFDATGKALLGTNDTSEFDNSPVLTNSSNAGPAVTITTPGIYYLAVSGFMSQPTLFGVTCFPQMVWEPGVIAGGVVRGWTGEWSGPGATGEYSMVVEGDDGVPAPGAAALLMLLPLTGGRRRRH